MPGVVFNFDGMRLVTNAAGEASVTEQHNFGLHTLSLVKPAFATRSRQYHFSRWTGQRDPRQALRPDLTGLPLRTSYTVTAGLTVLCPVTPRFVTQGGVTLDPRRISRVVLRSSSGGLTTLRPTGTTWLTCVQPVDKDSALSLRSVTYAVEAVDFSGTNIAKVGAIRFRPVQAAHPVLTTYFYDLTITAKDAIFGSATGAVALVTMPDHSIRQVPLGPFHIATLTNLPQGYYQVRIRAGRGVVQVQDLHLSRTTTVDLTVVSVTDLVLVGGTVTAAIFCLPLLSRERRKWLRNALRYRSREMSSA